MQQNNLMQSALSIPSNSLTIPANPAISTLALTSTNSNNHSTLKTICHRNTEVRVDPVPELCSWYVDFVDLLGIVVAYSAEHRLDHLILMQP